MLKLPTEPMVGDRDVVVVLTDVGVRRYTSDRAILSQIDWTVRRCSVPTAPGRRTSAYSGGHRAA